MAKASLLCLLAVSALGVACPAAQEKNYGKRPDWSITLTGGKKMSAADFDGKVVIVDFWATWCPPCRKEIPGFIQLQKTYGEKGLAIVGFSLDRDEKTHDDWVKANGMNYPSIYASNDAGRKILADFEALIGAIEGIPTTLVLDRKGQIVYKHVGYGSPESFEKVFKPLL